MKSSVRSGQERRNLVVLSQTFEAVEVTEPEKHSKGETTTSSLQERR